MRASFLLPSSLLLCTLLAGCRVDNDKNGNNQNVNISTPFGSMHVKSNDSTATASIGLTPYPGAVPLKKDDGDDGNAADVNLSFGSFKLGVHALELQTGDPESKVLTFYRHDMSRYGTVIACRGSKTVGTPTHTDAGLTCNATSNHDADDDLQLRAGSTLHQHIVGVNPRDGGTRIGLVALDLPPQAANHSTDSNTQE